MKQALLSLFFFYALHAVAQERKYYDWEWKPCEPSLARFISLTERTDSGWLRKDFFTATKKLRMRGLYKDSACKVMNGWFRYYYANEQVSSFGRYVNGEKDGLWLSWHFNGMMYDSVVYRLGQPRAIMAWHSNGYMADSSVYNDDGNAVHVYWFDNGTLSHSGQSYRGKKEGEWKYFHKNGQPAALEVYKYDELASRVYYDETGKQLADTSNRDQPAAFKGGNKKWRSYLMDNLDFLDGVKLVNTFFVTVVVAVTIDEAGNITDAYIDVPVSPAFDKQALKVMQRSPAWQPAVSHNRNIRSFRKQPITFGQVD
ncbi:MAG TPA: energy transducer TonB [Ferruginibacter sp.]|nr:energy transducer TonB [Ferruginibacter sp.]